MNICMHVYTFILHVNVYVNVCVYIYPQYLHIDNIETHTNTLSVLLSSGWNQPFWVIEGPKEQHKQQIGVSVIIPH